VCCELVHKTPGDNPDTAGKSRVCHFTTFQSHRVKQYRYPDISFAEGVPSRKHPIWAFSQHSRGSRGVWSMLNKRSLCTCSSHSCCSAQIILSGCSGGIKMSLGSGRLWHCIDGGGRRAWCCDRGRFVIWRRTFTILGSTWRSYH
jgi:hypothetical protein